MVDFSVFCTAGVFWIVSKLCTGNFFRCMYVLHSVVFCIVGKFWTGVYFGCIYVLDWGVFWMYVCFGQGCILDV